MVGLPELDVRPRLDALIELDETTQHELMEAVPSKALSQLGLGVFKKPQGSDSELWIGIKDPAMAEHGRWLFRSGPLSAKAGVMWLKCEQEEIALADRQTNMTIALSNMTGRYGRTIEYLKHMRPNAKLPTMAWLHKFNQVFDSTIAQYVALTPENIDWATAHDLLYHRQAWREANDMVGMPDEVLLRMHGFGRLLDHLSGRRLLEVLTRP